MTPSQPRHLSGLHLARWGITLGCLCLLWTIGYFGPFFCSFLFGLSLVGGVFLIAKGLGSVRKFSIVLAVDLAVGLITFAGVGWFAHQVFSNEEGRLPISGKEIRIWDDRHGFPLPGPSRIRLLNLNVLHGFPSFERQDRRFGEICAEIQRHAPDIVVLQEAWIVSQHGNLADSLAEKLGFTYAYARANGSLRHIGFEEGGAILSRFPILEAKRVVLKPKTPWWENRIAIIANVQIAHDERLTVVGVHLTTSDAADTQALNLLESRSPDIIAGDFNSLPDTDAIRVVVNRGYREAIPRNKTALPWIDHVFLGQRVQDRWEITETKWIITSAPVPGVRDAVSDHDGILVELARR